MPQAVDGDAIFWSIVFFGCRRRPRERIHVRASIEASRASPCRVAIGRGMPLMRPMASADSGRSRVSAISTLSGSTARGGLFSLRAIVSRVSMRCCKMRRSTVRSLARAFKLTLLIAQIIDDATLDLQRLCKLRRAHSACPYVLMRSMRNACNSGRYRTSSAAYRTCFADSGRASHAVNVMPGGMGALTAHCTRLGERTRPRKPGEPSKNLGVDNAQGRSAKQSTENLKILSTGMHKRDAVLVMQVLQAVDRDLQTRMGRRGTHVHDCRPVLGRVPGSTIPRR